MKRILFYGNFGSENRTITNGQTSKTRNFYNAFVQNIDQNKCALFKYNSANFKRNILINYLKLKKAIKSCDVLIMFPGGRMNLKILRHICLKNKKIKVYYPVVGGWLADRIKEDSKLVNWLKNIERIYPETKGLEQKLNELGLTNTKVSPVFTVRERKTIDEILSSYQQNKTHVIKFVYFGRISEKKGIYLAVEAIKKVNEVLNNRCFLDFYGALQKEENLDKFKKILDGNIHYCGEMNDLEVNRLGDYDFFLFPTFYEGEGFPATCVESLTYGTPIIASKWAYNEEIVQSGFNGFLFDLHEDVLSDVILKIIKDGYDIIQLKRNAFQSGLKYLPEIAIKPFLEDIKELLYEAE